MAFYHRKRLNELSTKITDSLKQLEVYFSESHVINPQYCQWLSGNIRNINIDEEFGMLERSTNIVEEMKSLLDLEGKRRKSKNVLEEKEKKNVIKQGRVEKRKQSMEGNADPYARFSLKEIGSAETDVEAGAELSQEPGMSDQ